MPLSSIRLVLLFCFSAFAVAAVEIKELQLATSESPPFQTELELDQGPVPKLVKAAFLARNIRAKVTFIPWPRALILAKTGLYHGIVGAWDHPERRKNFIFSSVLYRTELHLVSLKPITHTNLYQLRDAGKKLGLVRGYSYPPVVVKSLIETTEVGGDSELFNMLLRGRVDVILADLGSIQLWQQQHQASAKIQAQVQKPNKVYSVFFESKPVYFLLSKWDPANVQRMAEFELGLQALTTSGERKKILSRLPTVKP